MERESGGQLRSLAPDPWRWRMGLPLFILSGEADEGEAIPVYRLGDRLRKRMRVWRCLHILIYLIDRVLGGALSAVDLLPLCGRWDNEDTYISPSHLKYTAHITILRT